MLISGLKGLKVVLLKGAVEKERKQQLLSGFDQYWQTDCQT